MARSENDTWDLASSVGVPATRVAAGRAIASQDPDGLIDDPFAAPLVRAVGIDVFTKMVDGTLDLEALIPGAADRARANIAEMAVRTRFFDDHFETSTGRGIRQAVILAAGLDSRAAWRGRPAPWSTRSTSPRSSSSRPAPWSAWAQSPPPSGEPSRSTCVTTGPPHSGRPVSTRPYPRRGVPKAC